MNYLLKSSSDLSSCLSCLCRDRCVGLVCIVPLLCIELTVGDTK